MFTRSFIIALFVVCSAFINFPAQSSQTAAAASVSVSAASLDLCEGCYTERVLIDGKWYIIVYGPDGSIIDIYPDWDE